MNDVFVLDACALIALLNDESGADSVTGAYEKAAKGEASILMNKVNLLEVYYGFYREKGKEYAKNIIGNVKRSLVEVTEFSDDIFMQAGRLKSKYKISLADSIALAQAVISNGSLLTADHHEFDVIEQSGENIKFIWIRPKP